MTAEQFRSMALALPDAEEREHMGHPDFRVGGRIFASLGYPDREWAMVKLYPDQQRDFMAAAPKMFVPVKGAWGRQGCTSIRLKSATPTRVKNALYAAWRKAAVKTTKKSLEAPARPKRRKVSPLV
ncbi:MAG TPA: MmcQ/YjbR family DNA-binding protein [Acidobacteriaceae bacterium]|nr:MmcQ/YjbR family DNA-binding protein [Acidobacteriaceae bacterium]